MDGTEPADGIFADIDERALELLRGGADAGLSLEELYDIANGAAQRAAAPLVEALLGGAHEHAKVEREHEAQVRAALRDEWGPAFDLLSGCVKTFDEAFEKLHERAMVAYDGLGDLEVACAAGLMARAVRIGREVESLLTNGFPAGALARTRAIHETAIVAVFLYEHRETDVLERYWLHSAVDVDRRLRSNSQHADAAGIEPPSMEDLEESARAMRDLSHRFGATYRHDYGWAAAAIGKGRPNLLDLADCVGMSGLTPWLKWAHHEVHPTSHGDELNLGLSPDGDEYLVVARVARGLAEPAGYALASLLNTFNACSLLGYGRDPSDMIIAHAIAALVDHAIELFEDTEAALARADGATAAT